MREKSKPRGDPGRAADGGDPRGIH